MDRSTSGTDRAVSISVLASRSRDSSRTEASKSVILTVLLEKVVARAMGLLLEKIELEVVVKVDWLEVKVDAFGMVACGWEDTAGERWGWAGGMETMEKSVSRSEGILQMGWWAASMNSSLSFSFMRLAISFCRLDFSSSS